MNGSIGESLERIIQRMLQKAEENMSEQGEEAWLLVGFEVQHEESEKN